MNTRNDPLITELKRRQFANVVYADTQGQLRCYTQGQHPFIRGIIEPRRETLLWVSQPTTPKVREQ